MLLYHGSNTTIEQPKLVEQTRGLDFGPGFYLTTSVEQAAAFSKIVLKRHRSGTAAVNIYEFDITAAEELLLIRKFIGADAEWLKFVTENRLKIYSGTAYDMVIGVVANDTVMPVIQAYSNGFLNEEAALITLKTSKLADQFCLKTGKALALLKFSKAYNT
jgi:hypothetical protein